MKDATDKFVHAHAGLRKGFEESQGGFWETCLLCEGCESRCNSLETSFFRWFDGSRCRRSHKSDGDLILPADCEDFDCLSRLLVSIILRTAKARHPKHQSTTFSLDGAEHSLISAFMHRGAFRFGIGVGATILVGDAGIESLSVLPHRTGDNKFELCLCGIVYRVSVDLKTGGRKTMLDAGWNAKDKGVPLTALPFSDSRIGREFERHVLHVIQGSSQT